MYDIDLNHGISFSLSLPLMKAYTKLYKEGHQVIMMSPYEKTGRYNKVLYFKDNPNLVVPKDIVFGEKSSFYGYGFLKESGLNEATKEISPSFEPYDFVSSKIKNRSLYKSIRCNDIIDWREKDFTGTHKGRTYTYVNDRDFLLEEDWRELFLHYDNNIEFVHSLNTSNYEQAEEFLQLYCGRSNIIIPIILDKDKIKNIIKYDNAIFSIKNIEPEKLILFIFMIKTFSEQKIKFEHFYTKKQLINNLIKWGGCESKISFKEFLGDSFKENDYLNLKNRLLLKQDPKKISYKDFEKEYLTF